MKFRTDLLRKLTHQELDDNFKACLGIHNLFHAQDWKTAGTHGGTFTSGAYRTREFNTVILNNIVGASLATNQITLPSGVFWFEALATALHPDSHIARIYNVTSAQELSLSSVVYANRVSTSSIPTGNILFSGKFELGGTSLIELQSIAQTTTTFGQAAAVGQSRNIYSDVKIWKVG